MISIALALVMILWLISIFSFAKWRAASLCRKEGQCNVLNDTALQVYMKLSGVGVLVWACMMLARV